MNEDDIAARYSYRIAWSEEDLSHVGTCLEFPSLSWLADSPESALTGILHLVSDCVKDMAASGEACPPAATHRPADVLAANTTLSEGHPMTAIAVHYDDRIGRVVIELRCGLLLSFRPRDVQGLEGGQEANLKDIEISPFGLGIHFPHLDADIHIPSLLQGHLGSQQWMAKIRAQLDARRMAQGPEDI